MNFMVRVIMVIVALMVTGCWRTMVDLLLLM